MRSALVCGMTAAVLALGSSPGPGSAQRLPGDTATPTVTPLYEGWYPNPDGTITLSWGFDYRGIEGAVEIPFGPDNYIEPDRYDGIQPTHFPGGRHWGTFGIIVPADLEGEAVRWTLEIRGEPFSALANTAAESRIAARTADVNGSDPPELAFYEAGPWFAGPGGAYSMQRAGVMEPTPLTLHARDDGPAGASGGVSDRVEAVTLTWLKHSGPGDVAFDHERGASRVAGDGGSMTTSAIFSMSGEYVVRVRATDSSGGSGVGRTQCCLSNAFFIVRVN